MQEKIAKLREVKILFVEDETDLIDIISDTLSKLKANYQTALNGKIAYDLLMSDDSFDLVVTDINMPVMNGLELIEKVRETNKDIPFVIMSAHTESEYMRKAEDLGIDNYLLKPFDFIKFITLVSEMDLKKD